LYARKLLKIIGTVLCPPVSSGGHKLHLGHKVPAMAKAAYL
jgi:hypothetical protein